MSASIPSTLQFLSSSYSQVQGFAALVSLGNILLGVAGSVFLSIELYKHIVYGNADYFRALLRIGIALMVLNSLQPIGNWLSKACFWAAQGMLDGDVLEQAKSIWQQMFQQEKSFDDITSLLSITFWLYLLTKLQLYAMICIKVFMIEILWPVFFGLVVFSGALSIPIAVLSGNSIKAWALNLLEISIWPITFQMLMCLLFVCYQGEMKEMQRLSGLWQEIEVLEMKEELSAHFGRQEEAQKYREEIEAKGVDGKIVTLIKFWGLNFAFGFLCLFTPFISRMIARGESVGFVGGVAAAFATRFGWGAARGVRDTLKEKPFNPGNAGAHTKEEAQSKPTQAQAELYEKIINRPQRHRLDDRD